MRSVQVVLRSRSDVKAEAGRLRLAARPDSADEPPAPVDRDVASAERRGCKRWNAASPGVGVMDLLIAATPHAHGARPSSRNPADLAGLHEQLAVVKVRTISPPESDLDTTHAE